MKKTIIMHVAAGAFVAGAIVHHIHALAYEAKAREQRRTAAALDEMSERHDALLRSFQMLSDAVEDSLSDEFGVDNYIFEDDLDDE